METRILEVKTIMDLWARSRNTFNHIRAVNWINLSGKGGVMVRS